MPSGLLESVIVTELKAAEARSSTELAKTKYSISRLRWKKKIDMTTKMKFAVNMHTQILNTICSQCEGISKFVLMIPNVHLSAKRDDL
jgi:hypothetical protein